MKLAEIAEEINGALPGFRMAEFRHIRRRLKKLTRTPPKRLFLKQTIQDDWAFHWGGRKELQFNIGFEEVDGVMALRHGVAYSLGPSHTLPDPMILLHSMKRFNDYMSEEADSFPDMRLWHYESHQRSPDLPAGPIAPEMVKLRNFIFLGKRQPVAGWDVSAVLRDLDRLLPLYEYAEGTDRLPIQAPHPASGFTFVPGCPHLKSRTKADLASKELDVSLRHNDIQLVLYRLFARQHGSPNVRVEHPAQQGRHIDVVVRRGKTLSFYEVKTAPTARTCIRQALPQLLEYSYWPGAQEADRLIVVGEPKVTQAAAEYLKMLRSRFSMPVYYQQIDLAKGNLTDAS